MIDKRILLYSKFIKRYLGCMISLFFLLLLWPLMLIIAISIKCDSKGTVLFRQMRLGKNQKVFLVYKFRTMVPNAYEIGGSKSYESDPRITKIGSFLRKSSLDELPQLINILKGEMCIIGPRPILEEEYVDFKESNLYKERFKATPGLFCTVDIDYRANASREIQFEMDCNYANHITFLLDTKIFLKIFLTVLKQENIYKDSPPS